MRKPFVVFALGLAVAACGQSSTSTPPTAAATTASTTAAAKPPAATSLATSESSAAPVWDPASARSWDRNLLALMPEIDACIAQSPQTRMISYAGNFHGAVLVRMQGDQAVDCRVNNGVAQISPHNDALDPPGDGDAEFVRGPGDNPGGECYAAPEVRDASGNVLGWMIDTEGC